MAEYILSSKAASGSILKLSRLIKVKSVGTITLALHRASLWLVKNRHQAEILPFENDFIFLHLCFLISNKENIDYICVFLNYKNI